MYLKKISESVETTVENLNAHEKISKNRDLEFEVFNIIKNALDNKNMQPHIESSTAEDNRKR